MGGDKPRPYDRIRSLENRKTNNRRGRVAPEMDQACSESASRLRALALAQDIVRNITRVDFESRVSQAHQPRDRS